MGLSISAAAALASSVTAKNAGSSSDSGFDALLAAQASASSGSGSSGAGANSAGSAPAGSNLNDPAVQAFMKYMSETPAQKFEDQWLAEHHLTEADLKAMSPAKREQIMKEMEQDMKRAIEQKVQQKLGVTVTLSSS